MRLPLPGSCLVPPITTSSVSREIMEIEDISTVERQSQGENVEYSLGWPKVSEERLLAKDRNEYGVSIEDGQLADPEDLISNLPDECLALAFRKLEQGDLARCSLVCRRWMTVDADSRTHLILKANEDIGPILPPLLLRFVGLTKLVLKAEKGNPSIDNEGLISIATHCTQLRKLKLKNCKQITDDGLDAFSKLCVDLRKFSCGSCGFGGRGLNALLQQCVTLEDLTIKRSIKAAHERTPEALSPGGASLRRLCLKDQSTFHLWSALVAGSTRLETLILARNGGNWDRVLEAALLDGRLSELSQVYLERVQISDRGLQAISKCPKLEALVVVRANECTDAGLAAIAGGCPGLKRLHVEGWAPSQLADPGLNALASQCRQLQELVLVGNSVTVASLRPLATICLSLERLTLCNSESLGDGEVACLAQGCPSLRRLCIKGCPRVTDLGVISLANGCPSLQKLKIRRCSQVSQQSISFLRTHRPEVHIQLERRAGVEEEGEVVDDDLLLRGPMMESPDRGKARFSRARSAFAAGTTYVACTLRRWVGGGTGEAKAGASGAGAEIR